MVLGSSLSTTSRFAADSGTLGQTWTVHSNCFRLICWSDACSLQFLSFSFIALSLLISLPFHSLILVNQSSILYLILWQPLPRRKTCLLPTHHHLWVMHHPHQQHQQSQQNTLGVGPKRSQLLVTVAKPVKFLVNAEKTVWEAYIKVGAHNLVYNTSCWSVYRHTLPMQGGRPRRTR